MELCGAMGMGGGRGYLAEEMGMADVAAMQRAVDAPQRQPLKKKKKKKKVRIADPEPAQQAKVGSGLTWQGFVDQAVWRVQQRMQEKAGCGSEFLGMAKPLLTPTAYDESVEERAASLVCGYPLCSNPIADFDLEKKTYRLVLEHQAIYDTTPQKEFCSAACHKTSSLLRASLADNASASHAAAGAALLRLFPQLSVSDLTALNPRVTQRALDLHAADKPSAPAPSHAFPVGIVVASDKLTPFRTKAVAAQEKPKNTGKLADLAATVQAGQPAAEPAAEKPEPTAESPSAAAVSEETPAPSPSAEETEGAASARRKPSRKKAFTDTGKEPEQPAVPEPSRAAGIVQGRAPPKDASADPWQEYDRALRSEAAKAEADGGSSDGDGSGSGSESEDEDSMDSWPATEGEDGYAAFRFETLPVFTQLHEVVEEWVTQETRERLCNENVVFDGVSKGQAVPEDGETEGEGGVNAGEETDEVQKSSLVVQQLVAVEAQVLLILSGASYCSATLRTWLSQVYRTLRPRYKVVTLSKNAAITFVLLLSLHHNAALLDPASEFFEAAGLVAQQMMELRELLSL